MAKTIKWIFFNCSSALNCIPSVLCKVRYEPVHKLSKNCGMCDQQSLRLACAYAQSDQSPCLSLEYSMNVKLLTEHHLEFICLKGGCTGSSESTHVKRHIVGNHMSRLIYLLKSFMIMQLHFCLAQNFVVTTSNCASSRESLSSGFCEQHRRRPAWASEQSDQRLCSSRLRKYYIYTCYR